MGNEEFSFLDEDEEPDRDDFPERQVPKAARRRDLRGKLYTIPSSSTQADPAPGPVEPGAGDGKAHKYTLTFQPTKMPTATAPTGNTTPFLYALVTYWQGDMSYQFLYAFTTNALQVRRFFCCSADRIQVDLFVNPGINPSSGGEMRTMASSWPPQVRASTVASSGPASWASSTTS
jgi:hypothetical protein